MSNRSSRQRILLVAIYCSFLSATGVQAQLPAKAFRTVFTIDCLGQMISSDTIKESIGKQFGFVWIVDTKKKVLKEANGTELSIKQFSDSSIDAATDEAGGYSVHLDRFAGSFVVSFVNKPVYKFQQGQPTTVTMIAGQCKKVARLPEPKF